MKQLKLRFAKPDESGRVVEWLNANRVNSFDPAILNYPTLQVLCSYGDDVAGYLPFHKTLMLESIAMNPAITNGNKAQALRDMTKAATLIADANKIREVYFVGGNAGVGEMAIHNGHCFEELPYRVFRMKLS